MAKKSALGKGLGALLSDAAEEAKPRGDGLIGVTGRIEIE